ncbi:hypothetical protein Tco_0536933 [Tanacetum coccineum]
MIANESLRIRETSSTITITTVTIITIDSRIEDKKPSELILPPMDMLETFSYVRDVDSITRDLAVSSVRNLNLKPARDQAYANSLIYKEKTKKIHDSKIKNRVFNIGDRVLLFNSRLKIFSGKVKTHWTRPFTVAQVFPYGTVSYLKPMDQTSRIAQDYEDSRARSFVHRSLDLQSLASAFYGNQDILVY